MKYEGETQHYRYGFQGHEHDDEIKGKGNSYDYGARMYDPRVGRWLSIDNRQAKYPSLSPYNFVANNPIIYMDYNGEDFEITINHANNTITISESYFVVGSSNKSTIEAMNAGANFWNKQSGEFSYVLENKDGTLELYSINFEIKTQVIEPTGSDGKMTTDQMNENEIWQKSEVVTIPHDVLQRKGGHSDRGDGTMGIGEGERIYLSDEMANQKEVDIELIAHEMGHNLGLTHVGFLLMNPSLNDKVNVLPQNISDILGRAGIGPSKELETDRWPGGEMRSKTGEIDSEGTVMPTYKAEHKAQKKFKKVEKKQKK